MAPDENKDANEELNVSTSIFSSGLELNWQRNNKGRIKIIIYNNSE